MGKECDAISLVNPLLWELILAAMIPTLNLYCYQCSPEQHLCMTFVEGIALHVGVM